jgi:hypothetical protein
VLDAVVMAEMRLTSREGEMNFPRGVLFVVTLLGMPAIPGFGQDFGSNGNIQSAAPVPDFSGIWGRNFFFFLL